MTTAAVQNRISPPAPGAERVISDAPIKTAQKAVDGGNADKKTDFRDLLSNSNAQAKADREAIKNGNLAAAKTEDEFFSRLEKQSKPVRTPKNALDKDDFLKLFVTQLQYQDPSQPKDSSEMAAQLAQFNGLEQMMNINKGIEKLSKTQGLSRSLELVGYIGKEVTIPKGKLKLDAQGVNDSASFSTKTPITEASLVVRDPSGVIVAENNIGNFNPGEHKVNWDGKKTDGTKAANGVYNFEIMAKGPQGEQVPVDILSRVKITGVDLANEGSFDSEIGKIQVEDIKAVSLPGVRVSTDTAPVAEKSTITPAQQAAAAAAKLAPGPVSGPREVDASSLPPEILAALQNGALPPGMSLDPKATKAEAPNKPQAAAPKSSAQTEVVQEQKKPTPEPAPEKEQLAGMDPLERSQIFHPQIINNMR